MARYTGRDLVVRWITASGTTNVSADHRALDIKRKVASADATAGDDTYANKLPTFTDATAEYKFVDNTSNGSATYEQLAARMEGTLEWSPRGTTSTYRKYTAPAFIDTGLEETYPYDDVVEYTVGFQLTDVPTATVW